MAKKTFHVQVFWSMAATVEIAADTLEEAIDIAREDDNGDVFTKAQAAGEYLEGSYEVGEDSDADG